MAVGHITFDEHGDASGDGLAWGIFQEIVKPDNVEVLRAIGPHASDLCLGLARALDRDRTRIWEVGQASWMYSSIQAAIDAINEDPTPPSATNRCMVYIWPGYYESSVPIEVPSDVVVCGANKRCSTLYNPSTNLFKVVGPRTYFYNFLVKGGEDPTKYAFECNDQSTIRIEGVDMVATGGANGQAYLLQEGATWTTLVLRDITIDSAMLTGRLIRLTNSSGTVRSVGALLSALRTDCNSLTGYGGAIRVQDCSGVEIYGGSRINGQATYHQGVYVNRQAGTTGTPTVSIANSWLSGGQPVYTGAACRTYLLNSDADGSYTEATGTLTARNSET